MSLRKNSFSAFSFLRSFFSPSLSLFACLAGWRAGGLAGWLACVCARGLVCVRTALGGFQKNSSITQDDLIKSASGAGAPPPFSFIVNKMVAALNVWLSVLLFCNTSLASSTHLALRSGSLSLSTGTSTVRETVRGSLLGRRSGSPGGSGEDGEVEVPELSNANADDAGGSNSSLSDSADEGGSDSGGDDGSGGEPPLEAVSKTILRKLIVADAILTHQTLQLLTAKSHASLGKSMDDIDQVLTGLRGETARGITLTQEIAKKTAAGAQEINAIADEYLAEQQTVATMCTEALDKLAINSAVLEAALGNATGSPSDVCWWFIFFVHPPRLLSCPNAVLMDNQSRSCFELSDLALCTFWFFFFLGCGLA